MVRVYIPSVDEGFLRTLKGKGLGLPNAPHWIIARIALARSLQMAGFPDEELSKPLPSERGVEIDMAQLTGGGSAASDAVDYTDAYRLLLSVYHEVDLFSDKEQFMTLLQRHVLRGIQEIKASWRDGNDFHDYLFQELFFERTSIDESNASEISDRVQRALGEIGVSAAIDNVKDGPRISRYILQLNSPDDLDRLKKGIDKIPFELGIKESVILQQAKGERRIALDIPRPAAQWETIDGSKVPFWIENEKGALPVCPGTDVLGKPFIFDLAECPHLFVAGTTGSGKSVCLHAIILSLLASRKPVALLMIDPKKMDLSVYQGCRKLLKNNVITEFSEAKSALSDLVKEMKMREGKLAELGVTNISEAQAQGVDIQRIVVVIDELADLIGEEPAASDTIARLARMARATGIHLLLATQRPDAVTFPGQLRSNVPSRIALHVRTGAESRIILDELGAEKLLSKGDMLIQFPGKPTLRAHGAKVDAGHIKPWL